MIKKFPKSIQSLEEIFRYTAAFTGRHCLDASIKFALDLAIEEVFTNMVKYSKASAERVIITLEVENKDVIIQLIDKNVPPFDPRQSPEVDVQKPIEERPVGGLGLHLLKKVMDDVQYEYQDRESKITLVKKTGTQLKQN